MRCSRLKICILFPFFLYFIFGSIQVSSSCFVYVEKNPAWYSTLMLTSISIVRNWLGSLGSLRTRFISSNSTSSSKERKKKITVLPSLAVAAIFGVHFMRGPHPSFGLNGQLHSWVHVDSQLNSKVNLRI